MELTPYQYVQYIYIYTGQMVENDDETQNLIYIYILYRYDWGKQFG